MESRYGNSSKQIKDVCLVQASFSYRSDQFLTEEIFYSLFSVERTFPVHSPRLDRIEVARKGVVRRAMLYYLLILTGKAARIRERGYQGV